MSSHFTFVYRGAMLSLYISVQCSRIAETSCLIHLEKNQCESFLTGHILTGPIRVLFRRTRRELKPGFSCDIKQEAAVSL